MSGWARTWLFRIVFYGVSVPIVIGAPVSALFGRLALRRYVLGWTAFHRWATYHIAGTRVRIEGNAAPGPALYVAKHQAMFETVELARLLDAPVIVMKRELARIPLWGWAAERYGMIVVDRDASAAALRGMMRDARAAAAEGRPVVIFPEGTRVAPGEQPPLRSGFAGLYRMMGVPVVPVALDSGLLWPRKGPIRPGTITFRFGDPIPPGLPRAEIEARVHAAINVLDRGSGAGAV